MFETKDDASSGVGGAAAPTGNQQLYFTYTEFVDESHPLFNVVEDIIYDTHDEFMRLWKEVDHAWKYQKGDYKIDKIKKA